MGGKIVLIFHYTQSSLFYSIRRIEAPAKREYDEDIKRHAPKRIGYAEKIPLVLGDLTAIIAVLILTLIQVHSVRSGPQIASPTPHLDGYATMIFNQSRGTFLPAVPTTAPEQYTDLSPELSFDQKVAVYVLHSDGTRQRYDMAWGMLYSFIKKLPNGDTLLQTSPIYPASGGYALPTPVEMSSTPKVTDLVPYLNASEKVTLIVRHIDGNEEIFLIAPDRVDSFIQILPTEDIVIDVIPPASIVSHEPPTVTPEP
jgi:hypothetical protein